MNKEFTPQQVMKELGVAPSTAGIIAGLLNGNVDPDNFRSVETWALSEFDAPPQTRKVFAAVAELLSLGEDHLRSGQPGIPGFSHEEDYIYLDWEPGQPTLIWNGESFSFGVA
jgi:hypothetical protein